MLLLRREMAIAAVSELEEALNEASAAEVDAIARAGAVRARLREARRVLVDVEEQLPVAEADTAP